MAFAKAISDAKVKFDVVFDCICMNAAHAGQDSAVSYGCNKRRMELRFLRDMDSSTTGLQSTIFRPGHIYGPGFLLGYRACV